jgi:hypothetical protein
MTGLRWWMPGAGFHRAGSLRAVTINDGEIIRIIEV